MTPLMRLKASLHKYKHPLLANSAADAIVNIHNRDYDVTKLVDDMNVKWLNDDVLDPACTLAVKFDKFVQEGGQGGKVTKVKGFASASGATPGLALEDILKQLKA